MTIFQRIFSVDGLNVTRLAISARLSTPNFSRFSAAKEKLVIRQTASSTQTEIAKNLFIFNTSLRIFELTGVVPGSPRST
jgi:hypothetical protein